MGTFILVFFIVILVVAGMSVGVIFSGRPILGTCGGIGALGISSSCDICGGNTQKCDENSELVAAKANSSMAYDATQPRH